MVERLEKLERECIQLFQEVKLHGAMGPWDASSVEENHRLLREALICTPGWLRKFRRTFLAAGRLNFPDSPRPKEFYLQWGKSLPRGQRIIGAIALVRLVFQLRLHQKVPLCELDDNLVGSPTYLPLPKGKREILDLLGQVFSGNRPLRNGSLLHLTEARVRSVYYRNQISRFISKPIRAIIEIGGGYGGLAAELIRYLGVKRYYLVELPDALPLAYYYLKGVCNSPIEMFFRPNDRVAPSSAVVLVAPWKLPEVDESFDLLINTMSFQHMTRSNLDYYFREIGRLGVKWMYLVNRDSQRDVSDVPISEYPIPSNYHRVYWKPWLFGSHIEAVLKRSSELGSDGTR